MYQGVSKKELTNRLCCENFFSELACELHMGSSWYVLYPHMITSQQHLDGLGMTGSKIRDCKELGL